MKKYAAGVKEWRALDGSYSAGEFTETLMGWKTKRRFVVVRERIREDKKAVGRKLFEIPDYTFRVFVTNRADAPEDIWRDYNLKMQKVKLAWRNLPREDAQLLQQRLKEQPAGWTLHRFREALLITLSVKTKE